MKLNLLLFSIPLLMGCGRNIADNELRMLVGSYTDSGSHGLYSMIFNEETASFSLLDSCNVVNPSYVTFSSDNKFIYSVSETNDENASVYALSFDYSTGKMTALNSQPTQGTDPCYIATNGKMVVTANYGGSLSVFPLESDGSLAPLSQLFYGSTGGPDSIRQNTPHVHCAEFSIDGSKLYATDFSADRLLVYIVIDEGGKVEPLVTDRGYQVAIELDSDNGPRHIVFDKNGDHAYVIGELSGKITVLDKRGEIYQVSQVVDGDPSKGRGSADIHISPDGRFLYASNRLVNDGITIFQIDASTGKIKQVSYQLTGIHPRNFAISPNGKYLLCACRDSNEIQIFKRNEETGYYQI